MLFESLDQVRSTMSYATEARDPFIRVIYGKLALNKENASAIIRTHFSFIVTAISQ